jgi:hypothetical protein
MENRMEEAEPGIIFNLDHEYGKIARIICRA